MDDASKMTIGGWRTIADEIRTENAWWTYRVASVELPDGTPGAYHYVETPGSVMIIPVDHDGRLLLVRQFRYLNDRFSLEFPGGGIPKGKDPLSAATDELAQEASVGASSIELIGTFNPYNGVTSEICHVYTAHDLYAVSVPSDATEDCIPIRLTRMAFNAAVHSGDIWDGMTLAAWSLFLSFEHR